MLMLPLAEACWEVWKALLLLALLLLVPNPLEPLPESSSAISRRFRFPREKRVAEMPLLDEEVARETVIRAEGLGDSFSLAGKGRRGSAGKSSEGRACSPSSQRTKLLAPLPNTE